MRDVELMVASVSKASRIYYYIRERSPHYMQLKDVYNLIAMIKSSCAFNGSQFESSSATY